MPHQSACALGPDAGGGAHFSADHVGRQRRVNRPALILWIGLPAIVTIALLLVSYQVKGLESELAELEHAALTQQEEIHVLNAEWSFLNRPERLARLAKRHLDLAPVAPKQLITFSYEPLANDLAAKDFAAQNIVMKNLVTHSLITKGLAQ
jgi:cell division protein FtsL